MNSTSTNTNTAIPPQHPSTTANVGTGTGTGAGVANDGTTGNAAAQSVGDKIKGGWNVFHGAGEGIRGNINSFVDNVGEQIAGRGNTSSTTAPATRTEGGQRPEEVAAKGADELRAGMANIQK